MKRVLNVDISEIIDKEQLAPSINNELIIIEMNGEFEIKPQERTHLDAFTLILMTDGELDININGKDYHIDTKAFLDVLDIHAVNHVRRSPKFKGYHVIMSKSFVEETMRGIKKLPIYNFLSRCDCPIMELDNKDASLLHKIILEVIAAINRKEHAYHRDLVKNELRSLLIEVSNIIIREGRIPDINRYRNKEFVIVQFIDLMTKHCAEQHSVNFYADQLCIDDKYLSRILKSASGKTASSWIDDALMTQAKILLKDPDYTIQQIVDILHFSDQSAFGKFFKKHCGVPPLTYRNE